MVNCYITVCYLCFVLLICVSVCCTADVGESAEATAEPSVEAGDKEEEERAGEDEEPPKRETDGEPAQEVQVEEDEPAQEVGGERREERDVQPVAATNQEGEECMKVPKECQM